MRVPILIDGNNLLHHARRAAEASAPLMGRSMLCDTLGSWARRFREDVHIVFDGPEPDARRARQIGHPDLRVTFSGAGVPADTVIQAMLESDSAARRLVVVSSDRAVARAARRRRARSATVDEFWSRVQRDLSRPPRGAPEPTEKRDGLPPDATREWLEEFGFER